MSYYEFFSHRIFPYNPHGRKTLHPFLKKFTERIIKKAGAFSENTGAISQKNLLTSQTPKTAIRVRSVSAVRASKIKPYVRFVPQLTDFRE